MTYGGTPFPDELKRALVEDRLVIFAGAGVSYAPNASLRSIKDVLREAWKTFRPSLQPVLGQDGYQIAHSFGDLELLMGGNVCVRQYVMSEYGKNVEPSFVQKALVRLFGVNRPIRIVTTNYDKLLSCAVLQHRKEPPHELVYPRLDVGQKSLLRLAESQESHGLSTYAAGFHGIAYVHGTVQSESEDIILTWKDFARAYMCEHSIVAEFLRPILREYCVLMVGYSCGDPAVDLLLEACGDSNHIHALFPNNEFPKHTITGLEVHGYPVVQDVDRERYDNLRVVLEGWVKEAEGLGIVEKSPFDGYAN